MDKKYPRSQNRKETREKQPFGSKFDFKDIYGLHVGRNDLFKHPKHGSISQPLSINKKDGFATKTGWKKGEKTL